MPRTIEEKEKLSSPKKKELLFFHENMSYQKNDICRQRDHRDHRAGRLETFLRLRPSEPQRLSQDTASIEEPEALAHIAQLEPLLLVARTDENPRDKNDTHRADQRKENATHNLCISHSVPPPTHFII